MPGSTAPSQIPAVAYGSVGSGPKGRSPLVIIGSATIAALVIILVLMLVLASKDDTEVSLEQIRSEQTAADAFVRDHDTQAVIPRFSSQDAASYLRLQSGWLLSQAADTKAGVIWSITQGPRVAVNPLDGSGVDDDRGACFQQVDVVDECFQVRGHSTASVLVDRPESEEYYLVTVRENLSDDWFVEARTGFAEDDLPRNLAAFATDFLDDLAAYRPGQFTAEEVFAAMSGPVAS